MREEIERILKLLEEGKINADEAYKLIEALERSEKERKKEEEFGIFDVGKMVQDAIRTTFQVVPVSIRSTFRKRTISEEIDLKSREKLKIKVDAGDVRIKTYEGEKIKIEGEGYYELNEELIRLTGELDISVPELKRLELELSAGDVEASVKADVICFEVKAGDMDAEVESNKLEAHVKMGDLDIRLLSIPHEAELECKMGDLNLHLPDNFEGTIEARVSMGSLGVKREHLREGNLYIIGDRTKSRITARVKMGSVLID